MNGFERLYFNVKRININKELELILDDNNEFITDLNKTRLLEQGTDVDGKEIRTFRAAGGEVYSGFTISMRDKEGKQTKHVDLYDTGEFHSTFKVDSNKSSFLIEADTDKPDGKIEDNVDVESVLGLGKDGIESVKQILIPELRLFIRDELQT